MRAKVEVGVEGFESCFEDLEILRTSNAGIIMVWAIQKATAARCGCCIPNSGAHNDMPIKYTSEMTPEQAIAEIRKCLVRHGASAIMALIYGLKYQEDVSRGKPKNDDDDRWWGMMWAFGGLTATMKLE